VKATGKILPILRRCVDVTMSVLFFALLSFTYTGTRLHELFGILLGVAFVLHQLLNLRWYRSLVRGRYTAARWLSVILDLGLLADMILLIVSGISMGQEIIPSGLIPIKRSTAVMMHIVCGYLGFVLAGAHLGLHAGLIPWPLGRKRKTKAQGASGEDSGQMSGRKIRLLVQILASALGVVGLVRENFFLYISGRAHFVMPLYDNPVWIYIAELVCIWILAASITEGIQTALTRKGRRKKS
jgi:hypothetical protein